MNQNSKPSWSHTMVVSPRVAAIINEAIEEEHNKLILDDFVNKLNKYYLKGKLTANEFTIMEKLVKSGSSENINLCNAILKSKKLNVVLQQKQIQ